MNARIAARFAGIIAAALLTTATATNAWAQAECRDPETDYCYTEVVIVEAPALDHQDTGGAGGEVVSYWYGRLRDVFDLLEVWEALWRIWGGGGFAECYLEGIMLPCDMVAELY